ncbi:MAG TPA: aminoglycoside phosphotransferase family protein [Candidatus Binataceae bacterium]|nr:aminoglycoside phosphotransferase family protein [Candidatus Binataceae bacterium]
MPDAASQFSAEPEILATALSAYLGTGVEHLRVLASGWETTLYEFELRRRTELLPGVAAGAPLVLRFYPSVEAADKGALEYRVISHLAAAGYPVPRPYLFEPGGAAIGAPFLVMQRLGGGPLFAIRSFPQALKTFSMGFPGFVRAHARLHRMALAHPALEALRTPPAPIQSGLVSPAQDGAEDGVKDGVKDGAAGRLLERTLATIAARVEQGPLPGLAAALARLRRRAAEFRDAPSSFLHLDYHPQNVLVKGFRITGIIDWANAAIGDRHFDAATTAVILSTSAMEHPRWMRDNAAGNNLRRTFNALYLALYHASAPMELRRLRYYQGLAGALRLSMLGTMRVRGPQSVGFRPGAIGEVTPSVLRLLSAYVARKTGAAVTIP